MLRCIIKVKENKGSAMILAVLSMALISIFIGIVINQSINKIKSTNSRTIDIESKYMSESGIDMVIADIKYQIKEQIEGLKDSSNNYRANDEVPYINDIKTNLENSKTYMELVEPSVGENNKNAINDIKDRLDKLINTNSLQSKVYYDGISEILNEIIDLLYSKSVDDETLSLIFDDTYLAINQLHKALTGVHKYVWYYEKHYINIDNNHKHLSPLLEWDPEKPWLSQNQNASYVRNEIINGFVKGHWYGSTYSNIKNIIYINDVQKNSPQLKDDIAKQMGELNTLLTSDGTVNNNTTIWSALQNLARALQNNNKDSDTVKSAFETTKNSVNYTVSKMTDEMLRDVYKIAISNRNYVNKSLLVNAIRGLEHIKYNIIETADRLGFLEQTKEDAGESEQVGIIYVEVKKPVITKKSTKDEVNYDFEKDLIGNIKTTEYILDVKISPDNKFEVSPKDIDIISKSKLYSNKEYELNTNITISSSGEISNSNEISMYTFDYITNLYNRKN